MILTIAGGGSTFTPGIVKSIALRQKELDLKEIRLFDIDKERQDKVAVVVDWILKEELKTDIKLTVTTDEKEAYRAIKLFIKHIDRTLTDSFVHANIGPRDTKAGRIVLSVMQELQCAVPNLTVKYDEDITSKEFIELCASTALTTAKPSFANHKMYRDDFKSENYAIASCYNGFIIGGGGYTLVRLLLQNVAYQSVSIEDFMENKLPFAVEKMLKYIDERVRFLVQEAAFFNTNFLVLEGFINKELFTGMFGVVGLAEAINHLLQATEKSDRYGYSKVANDLGLKTIEKVNKIVTSYKSKYVGCFEGQHLMHAQVGIDRLFMLSLTTIY